MSRDPAKDRLCKLSRETFDGGRNLMAAISEIVNTHPQLVAEFVTKNLYDTIRTDLRKEWAEPLQQPPLQLPISGAVEWVPDRVLLVDDEFRLRRYATFDEAIESDTARIEHHRGEQERARRDRDKEREVRDIARAEGLDVTKSWDELTMGEEVCWRCGGGWRPGDPFESGHVGTPGSKGGVQVAWEHASCNRSAGASVTSAAPLDDE